MRIWGLVMLGAVGCGSYAEGDLVGQALSDAKGSHTEEQHEASEPRVWSICADSVALELEPELDTLIADAMLYWQDQPGLERLIHKPGETCDISVRFTDETHWENSDASARAVVRGGWKPGCKPDSFSLREAHWNGVKERKLDVTLVVHEMGHLLCLPHTEYGIMAPDGS